jgi:F-type H+-transporting ATPase subunit epsilon
VLYVRPFRLRIITPTRVLFEEEVTGVRAPGSLAPFEVLAGHAPIVSGLDVGPVRLTMGNPAAPRRRALAISGGVLEATREGVALLAHTAEWAEEIDVARAERSRDRALQRLRRPTPDMDLRRAEAALARALNRLAVSAHAG